LQMAQDLPAKANVPTSMDFSQENDTWRPYARRISHNPVTFLFHYKEYRLKINLPRKESNLSLKQTNQTKNLQSPRTKHYSISDAVTRPTWAPVLEQIIASLWTPPSSPTQKWRKGRQQREVCYLTGEWGTKHLEQSLAPAEQHSAGAGTCVQS
jgi:hypothetical protein